jgi:hypothetical protein
MNYKIIKKYTTTYVTSDRIQLSLYIAKFFQNKNDQASNHYYINKRLDLDIVHGIRFGGTLAQD